VGEVRGSCTRDSPGIPAPARKRLRGARTSEQQGPLRTHSPLPGCERRGGGKLETDRLRRVGQPGFQNRWTDSPGPPSEALRQRRAETGGRKPQAAVKSSTIESEDHLESRRFRARAEFRTYVIPLVVSYPK